MWPFRRGERRAGEGPRDGLARAATPGTPRPGDVIDGKYRVERVLGVGGMGVVVAARHLRLGETVALKVLLPSERGPAERADVQRFLREGRAASRLRSEHVVRVLDLGEQPGGAPYLVMEHLVGRDLAAVLAHDGPLPVDDAVGWLLDACESIAEAHAVGVVHRDLKPANLFVARRADGSPCLKVLDFGISKVEGPEDLSLTQTRTLMGSPVYMAPEIMRSARAASPRSDIWSLGVILYELLTGAVPFHADTITELTVKVLEEQPRPISTFRADVPPEVDGIVATCLEKDPARRFASVEDLALALATLLGLPGLARLDRLRRVSRDAEARARQGADASGDFPVTPVVVGAEGQTTVRGVTTMPLRAPGRGRIGVLVALGLGVVAGSAAVVLLATRDDGPRATSSAKSSATPQPVPTPSTSTSSEPTPAPRPSASQPVATASSAAKPPKAAPKSPPPKAGKPTLGSPYFDDPN